MSGRDGGPGPLPGLADSGFHEMAVVVEWREFPQLRMPPKSQNHSVRDGPLTWDGPFPCLRVRMSSFFLRARYDVYRGMPPRRPSSHTSTLELWPSLALCSPEEPAHSRS